MSEQSESNVVEFADLKFPVIEYGVTEAEIAEVAERYKNPDASTDEGYEHCKEGVRTLTAMRTAVETRRLDLKRPITKWVDVNVDGRGKKLIRQIRAAEKDVRAEKERVDNIKQQEARKAAQAEQDRIAGIRDNIEKIKLTAREQKSGDTSADYQTHITWLSELAITEEVFGEFVEDATTARDAALFKLTQWYKDALEREEDDKKRVAEQAKLDKQREEQEATAKKLREKNERLETAKKAEAKRKAEAEETAKKKAEREQEERNKIERRRVAKIREAISIKETIPDRAKGMTSEALDRFLIAESANVPDVGEFAELLDEAMAAWQESINTLERMSKEQRETEEKAAQDEEARLPDKEKLIRWCDAIAAIAEPEVLNDKAQKLLKRYAGDLSKFTDRMRSDISKL